MALEPTDDQIDALVCILPELYPDQRDTPGKVWAYVRDQVLEEAAKACYIDGIPIDSGSCAARIRAMKGTP